MKKLVFSFALMFIAFILNAQTWSSVYNTDNADFRSLQFFDGTSGYVAGGLSTTPYLLKTINGGDSWLNKNTGISEGIVQDLAFQDINSGFVTTSAGKLYKTDNGADSWTEVIPETDYLIFGVTYAGNFSGNEVYYAYGMDKLFKTTNFGDNWTVVFSESFYIFYQACVANGNGIEFYNENEAYFIFNSDLEVYNFDGSSAYSIYGFSNSSSQGCIDVLSEDLLFASSGARFVKISNPGDYQITNNLTSALYISDLDFVNGDLGFGVSTNGKVYNIISGGYTANEEYESNEQLNSIDIADNNTVYAVGNNGEILKREGSISNINTITENNLISIYPTVSSGQINIKIQSNDLLNTNYQIIDITGKIMKTGNVSSKQIQVDFPVGIYMFQILGQNVNSKFIIQ